MSFETFAYICYIAIAAANVFSARMCLRDYRETKERWFLLTGLANLGAAGFCIYLAVR